MRRLFAGFILLLLALTDPVRAQEPVPTPLGGLAIGGTPANVNLAIGETVGTPVGGVSGLSYLSPTYGFRVSWDASWKVDASSSAGGEDRLRLINGKTTVDFDAHPGFGGDPVACLQAQVQSLQSESGITDLRLAAGTNGQPLQGVSSGKSFAVYTETFAAANGTKSELASYLDCRTLVPGATVLDMGAVSRRSDFNDQISAVQTLLATLVLPAATVTPPVAVTAISATATAPANAACQGIDAWVASSVKNVSAMVALETEMKTPTADIFTADGRWASLFAALAQAQAALPTPPVAAKASADLAHVFQQTSDSLTTFAKAMAAGDSAGMTVVIQQLSQVDAEFGAAQGEVQTLSQQCGVPVKITGA